MTEEAASQPDSNATDPAPHATDPAAELAEALDAVETPSVPIWTRLVKRLSMTHLLLSSNALAVLVLAGVVLWMLQRPPATPVSAHTVIQHGERESVIPKSVSPAEPRSVCWEKAESAFADNEIAIALQEYVTLLRITKGNPALESMSDLFQLRIGQCLARTGEAKDARNALGKVSASRFAAVRATANFHLALLDEANGQYLQARMRAYLAASALAALPERLAASTDCDFLVARVLTRKILSFHGADEAVEWDAWPLAGPFSGLEESALRERLRHEVGDVGQAVLGPKVQRLKTNEVAWNWTASSVRGSVSDLLSRFATQASIDLQWDAVEDSARKRSVHLYFRKVSGQKLCELTAGSVGLLARFTGESIIIHNPSSYQSLDQQRGLLAREAIAAWRRVFLRYPRDSRIPEGHYALAVLHEHGGNTIAAANEYRLTVARFGNTRVAPKALLRAAELRLALRDYTGARDALTSLLDTYPDCQESNDAYLVLGEATLQAGLSAEALGTFRKLYFQDVPAAIKARVCLGIGKCLIQEGDPKEAVKFLNQYIKLADKTEKARRVETYRLLGQCWVALGNDQHAGTALRLAVAEGPSAAERISLLLEQAEMYQRLGDYPSSIATLDAIAKEVQSPQQKYRRVYLTAQAYRAIGLPDEAGSFLRGNIPTVSRSPLRAKLAVELARCYREDGKLSEAYELLVELVGVLSPKEAAWEATCDLAELCLQMGRPKQTITLTRNLLKSVSDGPLHQRAKKLKVDAHLANQDYEKVALVVASASENAKEGKKP